MATKKSTKQRVVVGDETTDTGIDPDLFDSWTPEAEEAAIQAAADAADIKYVIIEGRIFAGRFPNGEIVQAPLNFSVQDLDKITAEFDNPVDQVKALLAQLGDGGAAQVLERQNLTSTVIFAERFFDTFQKIAQVALKKYSA